MDSSGSGGTASSSSSVNVSGSSRSLHRQLLGELAACLASDQQPHIVGQLLSKCPAAPPQGIEDKGYSGAWVRVRVRV